MKLSKRRRVGEAILGMLIAVAWPLCAYSIRLRLTAFGFAPDWAVRLVSALVGFIATFAGLLAIIAVSTGYRNGSRSTNDGNKKARLSGLFFQRQRRI